MRHMRLIAAAALLVAGFGIVGLAVGLSEPARGDETCPEPYNFVEGIGCARDAGDGLKEVRLPDGWLLMTHGPDSVESVTSVPDAVDAVAKCLIDNPDAVDCLPDEDPTGEPIPVP